MSISDVETLLAMPDHLRRTLETVLTFGAVTAGDAAQRTGRARAVESSYLNQLSRMGLLEKARKGRNAYFYKDGFSLGQQQKMVGVMGRYWKLPVEFRRIFWDDLMAAMSERIRVLEKASGL